MLSIIISSYQPHYFTALEKNIAETCGITYEIIKIDNPGLMGICEAYNKGAAKAKFENLLFLHEDVVFHNNYWGRLLIRHLLEKTTGVVGFAGSSYIPNVPLVYWDQKDYKYHHLIQMLTSETITYELKEKKQVFALDGFFLACRKEVYNENKFNESIRGFHGYDIEFTLHTSRNYNNYVINDFFVEHLSIGSLTKSWYRSLIKVRNFYTIPKQQKSDRKIEFEQYVNMIYYLKKYSFTKIEVFFYIVKFFNYRYFRLAEALETLKITYRIIR